MGNVIIKELSEDWPKWDKEAYATAEVIAAAVGKTYNAILKYESSRNVPTYGGKGRNTLFRLGDIISVWLNRGYHKKSEPVLSIPKTVKDRKNHYTRTIKPVIQKV